MPLIEVTDSNAWDGFIAAQPRSQFTQSWAWGEFRASQGQSIQRLALVGPDGKWDAAALFAYHQKPIVGGYWYAPRGPVVRSDLEPHAGDIVGRFMDDLSKRGLPRRAFFWRIEPPYHASVFRFPLGACPERRRGAQPGLVRSHAYMPASTLLVDLSKTEEQLLTEMHEKTRYNVRVAERNGVTVRAASSPDDIDTFLRLNEETAARDRFVSQPSEYIRATFEFLQSR
ncbi:MAG TPA: peptidoglycan bridge formation glycyltransferase FemA/FemB family protein, partial [Candidatus Methylomirabilis sp.]|nr:peptidoglycan bridge formation glycyltransferase FemA/FemB family protein [Candidatus Methylomirabilis sp.]